MLLNTINEVREEVKNWREKGLKVGLVPTMGALHEGHLSLIKKAKAECDKVVVSVFVNPIQFGPSEDFDKYPRTLDADMALCDKEGVDVVFAPNANEMYGGGRLSNDTLTYVCPPYFYVDKLCGKSRVGHFDGVCTVVMKLFNIVQPDCAYFGQKDAQQVIIIKKMVQDLNIPIKIIQCPIVREESGLALSSRNKYLSEEGKKDALALSKILNNIKACYNKGITDISALKETAYSYLTERHDLEYLEMYDKNTLDDIEKVDENNIDIAIKVQNTIFPEESGAEDIRQSLNGGENNEHKFKIYFLAKVDGKVVGITGLYAYKVYPKDAWLGWFGVLEEERRKGYATEIVNFTMQKAKEMGYQSLHLYTDEEDNKDAVKFYEKLGMQVEEYSNEEDNHFEISRTLIFSKSLTEKPLEMWNNKNLFLNVHDCENGILNN